MPIFMDSTHTYFFILMCLLTLAPSVNLSVDTLAKAKRLTHFYSVASLLEKWFACFPTSGDGLHFARLIYRNDFCVSHFPVF